MADVLFASTYTLKYDPKQERIGRPYPPLGTILAAAVVRREGHNVQVFDSMLSAGEDAFAARLDQARPEIVVLYDDNFNWLSKMCLTRMRAAATNMIRIARQRHCIVLCNGSDVSDHPDIYLNAGANAVLLGEGELTLVELIPIFANLAVHRAVGSDGQAEAPLDSVAGLALPDGSGGHRRTASRDKLVDLDSLPLPAWDLIALARYQTYWRDRHGYFSLNLATTRGCPYQCNWCAKPIFGRRYSSRSPENVVKEMMWLTKLIAPDHYWIADDIFGLKPGWVERFSNLVDDAEVRVPFTAQCRPDLMNAPFVDSLRKAGCTKVWLGAESGSQKILDAMDKGTTLGQIRRARGLFRDSGIECAFFLQFGYPGESWREIEMTLDMVRDLIPDDIGISVSYPLPGTPFFDRVKVELGDKQNWSDSGDLDMLFAGEYTPEFYRVLHRRVHAEFIARKTAIRLKDVVFHPWKLRVCHVRHFTRAVRHAWRWWILQRRIDHLKHRRNPRRNPIAKCTGQMPGRETNSLPILGPESA